MKLQTALKSLLLIAIVLAAALVGYRSHAELRRGVDSAIELASSGIQVGSV